jgi:hypothetical protein
MPMAQDPFRDTGEDGARPRPGAEGSASGDGNPAAPWPAWLDDDDFDVEAYAALLAKDEPGPGAGERLECGLQLTLPAIPVDGADSGSVSEWVAVGGFAGPTGLGDAAFPPPGQRVPESLPPGPALYVLTEDAAADGGLTQLTEAGLVGMVAAARRLRSRCEWLEVQATEEFTRRTWQLDPGAGPERDPDGRLRFKGRDAEHAHKELAMELVEDPRVAEEGMDLSLALRDRLPMMSALLAAGRIDHHRCAIVHAETSMLSDDDARTADAMIAPCAPELRYDALRRKARVVAMMLDPDADRQRKHRATRRKARVEVFPEKSGNYAFAGRELPADEALAAKAHVEGIARYLMSHGVPGSLREIELMVYLDLTQGRNPYHRLPGSRPQPADVGTANDGAANNGAANGSTADAGAANDGASRDGSERGEKGWSGQGLRGRDPDDHDRDDSDEDYYEEESSGSGGDGPGGGSGGRGPGGGRSPFPASIHLLVPVGTLLGWSNRPGEAGREIIDSRTTRDLVRAASRHPRTRWDITLIGADGTAVAHGRARGQHPWTPATAGRGKAPPARAPTPGQRAELAALLADLGVSYTTIAKGTCDHASHEDRYRPSAALQGLIRARNATCPSPVCGAHVHRSDIDHTNPWPHGPTCQCNLGPPCRNDHRTKQAPGWELTQPEPGVFRWKTPNGRAYWTGPTRYDMCG